MAARKVTDKKPIKAEMGKWNFKSSEVRDGKTMWLVECDCRRTIQWMSPCAFKESKQCMKCGRDQRKETYRLGREQRDKDNPEELDDKDFLQFEPEEKVAPQGQLSLDSFKEPQEHVSPQIKESIEEGLLYQLEYSLKLAIESAYKLKEAQLKRSMK